MTQASTPVAMVLGAGENLGAAIARRFARGGFHVVATRRRGDLDTQARQIRAGGGACTPIHSDVRDEAAVQALFEQVESGIGPARVLVFNVGGNVRFFIAETTSEVYRKVWEMCPFGGFLAGRETDVRTSVEPW